MRKIISFTSIIVAFSLLPTAMFAATFEHDLYFGMRGNDEVRQLQEFLAGQGLFYEKATGNFFTLTRQALIAFQQKEGITPALGYFGPLTRARVMTMLGAMPMAREQQIALLQSQIKELQKKLADLFAMQAPTSMPVESSPAPTPLAPSVTPSPVATPEPIQELRITGTSTQPFPDTAFIPYKLGDITIKNTTTRVAAFAQFQLDIYDAMNSSLNRGKTVIFKLRNGTTTYDSLISETNFVVNSEPPPYGEAYNRRQLDVSFPVNINQNETKTISLWIENLDYVISGSLRIVMLKAYMNDGITPQGVFDVLLTR